jgi:hypothetical protein
VRIVAAAPLVRDRLEGAASNLKHTQHVLSSIVSEAEAQRVVVDIKALDDQAFLPRHMELYLSNCGDTTTLGMVPSDSATTLSNRSFEIGIIRRLLLSIIPVTRSERRRCLNCHKVSTCDHSSDEPGRSVDEFGDHTVGCKAMLHLRTVLWHDPVVLQWYNAARMAGSSCGHEVYDLMAHSGKRPDVAIFMGLYNILIDVRTIAGADPRYCAEAALTAGHGAVWGASQKNDAWLAQTQSQGDKFVPACHEAGGSIGEPALALLDKLVATVGGSVGDRTAFRIYILQRLHAASFRGVAMLVLSRPVMRTGPEVLPERGTWPVGSPPARSVINFSSLVGSAHEPAHFAQARATTPDI